jgi:predicted DNA-binding protein
VKKNFELQVLMKIFMETEGAKSKEKKLMYSTTLPKNLRDGLQEAAQRLHRKKADWVRAALAFFLRRSEGDQENLLLNAYENMDASQLRPFTTTLWESQMDSLNRLSKKIKRSKADIIRAAIFALLARDEAEQEKEIKNPASRVRVI